MRKFAIPVRLRILVSTDPKKNEILHNIPPIPDQKVFIKKLMVFARSGDSTLWDRDPLS